MGAEIDFVIIIFNKKLTAFCYFFRYSMASTSYALDLILPRTRNFNMKVTAGLKA